MGGSLLYASGAAGSIEHSGGRQQLGAVAAAAEQNGSAGSIGHGRTSRVLIAAA
jgi:hypothetical protein